MLEGRDGPLIMEVNSSPGLEGIEGATQLDVAGAIIQEIDSQVAFPDVDVRQRLTVSVGYGVAELRIPDESALVGQSIEASGLLESDVSVLTLTRGGGTVPNPRKTRLLAAGDLLLCFGRLESMRALVPTSTRNLRALGGGPPPVAAAAELQTPRGMDVDSDETT